MPFDDIVAQDPAVATLTRALESRRVHHAYRFEGPPGVGKEKAALALAQALVCERDVALGCGACSACKRATSFSPEEPHVPLHPDVVFVQRGLYPQSIISASEGTGISVEQIRRVVLGRAGYAPHEGRALVFIVRDAEELTPQAANAMLKTLEEPADKTHFVLLTSRPNRLLDTVRSRTQAVRFGALPEAVIAKILGARGLDARVAPLAQGSASQAIELADASAMAERDELVRAARAAIEARDLATAIEVAQNRPDSRDALRVQLGFLAYDFADEARRELASDPVRAERAARRHALVVGALNDVDKNVQPALVLESMFVRLRRV